MIAHRRHHFQQHRAEISLDRFFPFGVAQRGEIQQGPAQTVEIAREVVDIDIDQRIGGAVGHGLAVEPRLASLLEVEQDRIAQRV